MSHIPPFRTGLDKDTEQELAQLNPPDKDGFYPSSAGKAPEVAYKKGRLTTTLLLAVCASSIGSSFTFGYNIGVINQPKKRVQDWIVPQLYPDEVQKTGGNLSLYEGLDEIRKARLDEIFGWIVAVFCIGGMIGGLLSGVLADKFGRKGGMLINNVFCFLAALLLGISKESGSYYTLIAGRLVVGFNAGLNTALAPLYLTEIAPVNLRGALGSVHQLMVTVSILFSMLIGLPDVLGSQRLWPLLFAFTAAPGVFQLLTLPFCPESPKHLLINKHQTEQAERALIKLRQTHDVRGEMDRMEAEAAQTKNAPKVRFLDMFKSPLLWPLIIAVAMMFSQQLSGINAAMYYSTEIFKSAGLTETSSMICTIVMGIINVIMTVISMVVVDRFGRRTLHLVGMIGMWITSILLVVCLTYSPEQPADKGVLAITDDLAPTMEPVVAAQGSTVAAYFAIIFVFLFVISFATGPGSIPWFYVSETFLQGSRGHANSIAVVANWFTNFIVAVAFLPLQNAVGQYCFLVFTGFLTVFVVFTYFFVPETKGRTVDDIVADFERGQKRQ